MQESKLTDYIVNNSLISSFDLKIASQKKLEFNKMLIGQILVYSKLISQSDLDRALQIQIRDQAHANCPTRRRLGEVLVDEGIISEHDLNSALQMQKRFKSMQMPEVLVELDLVSTEKLNQIKSEIRG